MGITLPVLIEGFEEEGGDVHPFGPFGSFNLRQVRLDIVFENLLIARVDGSISAIRMLSAPKARVADGAMGFGDQVRPALLNGVHL